MDRRGTEKVSVDGKKALPQQGFNGKVWCARQDLNLHALRHYHLKVARLPIPPRARVPANTGVNDRHRRA